MRLLIAEDELLARSSLTHLCRQQPDIEIVAGVETGAAAIEAARAHHPDLLLLDAELRDMSGFEVLDSVQIAPEPLAIIVTAQPQNAVQAYEANAVDCLTKPVNAHRLHLAIGRARDRLLSDRRSLTEVPRHLAAEKGHRLFFIGIETIDCIRADGNYVLIHSGQERYIARNTVKNLSELLTPAGFVRIARSLVINLSRVAYAERAEGGAFEFTLRSGECFTSTPSFRRGILEEIHQGRRRTPIG